MIQAIQVSGFFFPFVKKKKSFPHDIMVLDILDSHCGKCHTYQGCEVWCTSPPSAAAFVPTTAVEEALKKSYKHLRWKIAGASDTENLLRPQFPHDTHKENLLSIFLL